MHASRIAGIVPVILLAACAHHASVTTVVVIDTSLSITPRAERATEDAIYDQISRLGRGDRLVVIPITGDAQNDAGGRILRLQVPSTREPYDADLRRFQADAKKQYAAWTASLDRHQQYTDILGTLDLVRQEFLATPKDAVRRLIVLSDFLEDEPALRFVSSSQLATAAQAKEFAEQVQNERGFAPLGAHVCLGRLESSDYASLSPLRKQAVQAFWAEYLSDHGQPPVLRFDGMGLLRDDAGCDFMQSDAAYKQTARGKILP